MSEGLDRTRWWYPLSNDMDWADSTPRAEAKAQGPHPFNVLELDNICAADEAEHFVGRARDEHEVENDHSPVDELRYFWRGGSGDTAKKKTPYGSEDTGWLLGNLDGVGTNVVFGWCDESIGKDRPRYMVEHRWRNPYTLKMERGSYKVFDRQWDAWFYATLLYMTIRRVTDTIVHATYKTWDMTQEWEG